MQISDPLLKVQGVASMGLASMGEKSEVQVGHPFQIKAIKTRAEALKSS